MLDQGLFLLWLQLLFLQAVDFGLQSKKLHGVGASYMVISPHLAPATAQETHHIQHPTSLAPEAPGPEPRGAGLTLCAPCSGKTGQWQLLLDYSEVRNQQLSDTPNPFFFLFII